MSQQIRCPHCGQTYDLTPEQVPQYAGQTINCTNCKQAFTVPQNITASVGAGAGEVAPVYPQQAQRSEAPGASPQHPIAGAVGYGGYQPPPRQETNGLAIASFVVGILGLLIGLIIPFIPSLPGIILGILALRKTKDPRVGGKGFAIAGLSISVLSFLLGICALSILLPSLNRARETANRVKCASNLRQIGQALLLYANDNRGAYPADFPPLLLTQDITSDVFTCPSTPATPAVPGGTPQQQAPVLHQHCSYIYVPGGNNASPADRVIAYEPMTNHDGDGANFLFGDGHVSWEGKQQADAMIKSIEAGQNPPATR